MTTRPIAPAEIARLLTAKLGHRASAMGVELDDLVGEVAVRLVAHPPDLSRGSVALWVCVLGRQALCDLGDREARCRRPRVDVTREAPDVGDGPDLLRYLRDAAHAEALERPEDRVRLAAVRQVVDLLACWGGERTLHRLCADLGLGRILGQWVRSWIRTRTERWARAADVS